MEVYFYIALVYSKYLEKAKVKWAGKIAVENLVILNKFSKLEN